MRGRCGLLLLGGDFLLTSSYLYLFLLIPLPPSSFLLPTSYFLLPTSYLPLTTYYLLLGGDPTSYFLLPTYRSLLTTYYLLLGGDSREKSRGGLCVLRLG